MRWVVGVGACVVLALLFYLRTREATPRAEHEASTPAEQPKLAAPNPNPPGSPAPQSSRPLCEVRTRAGDPVAGAHIEISGGAPVVTGEDGRAEFDWPKDKERARFNVKHHELLDLSEERAHSDGEWIFVLDRGLSVAGRVEFPDGKPAPNRGVNAATPGDVGPLERSWTVSDANGNFEMTGLREGVVWVQCGGDPVRSRAGVRDLRFVINESWLRRRIEDREGRPIAPSFVGVSAEHAVYLDEEGQRSPGPVEFEVPTGKDLTFHVAAQGFRHATRHLPAWSQTAGFHECVVVLEPSGGASVRFEVRDATEAKPKEIRIHELGPDGKERFAHRRVQSEDEPIVLGDLDPGVVRLRVFTPGERLLWRDVDLRATLSGGKIERIDLPQGAPLRIQLPSGDIRGIHVRIRPVGEEWMVSSMIDREHLLTTDRLPEGAWRLTAVRGEETLREQQIEVRGTKEIRLDWSDLE